MPTSRTVFRTCPLCEATCGLAVELEAIEPLHDPGAAPVERIRRIRGDRDDVFSGGYLCPKGSTLRQLHEDPDRVRGPLVKRDGQFVEASWDEAFETVAAGWDAVVERHGRAGTASYLGNPTVHSLEATTYVGMLLKAIGSPHRFSAATVDQRPKELVSGLLFGLPVSMTIPDIDHTDYALLLGANPVISNGSLATAPDWPGRLAAIRARGGRVVVADPRRTETAERADEWLALRPSTDALFLGALVTTIAAEGLIDLGPAAPYLEGVDAVIAALAPFTADAVADTCGLDAATIVRVAREFALAPRAVAYGRMGTTTQRYGTTTSWLIDVLNALTGNLDRPGGAMFPAPATGSANLRGTPRYGRGFTLSTRRSRVSGLPIQLGELSVGAMAEEILTPGDDQIRALLTLGGNPSLSVPNSGGRLDEALASLEFMVSVDIYVNETTRHADVILPVPSPLQRPHYDLSLYSVAIRNVANFSPATFPLDAGQPAEWELLARLAGALAGQGPNVDPAVLDDGEILILATASVADPDSPFHGWQPHDVLDALGERRGAERLLDFKLRTGPYGRSHGASLDALLASPHGVDYGPMRPRLPDVLRTASGMVELAPAPLLGDLDRLAAELARATPTGDVTGPDTPLVLIGRRDLRSNNSWMGNIEVLVKGRERCTLLIHPADAAARDVPPGALVTVRSRVGEVTVAAELTDAMTRGVVSLPHGWGHDVDGVRMKVAASRPGVNANLLTDDRELDPLSGTSVINGIPVHVAPAAGPAAGWTDERRPTAERTSLDVLPLG